MENAPTGLTRPPQLLPFSAAPRPVDQLTIFTAPPPTFPGPPSFVDLSPLKFLLALVAVVSLPALVCTLIYAVKCPSRRWRPDEASRAPSVVSENSHDADAVVASDVKYQKESHVKEMGSECPVCLSVFADGEEIRQLRVCKHSFHASCIDMWLSNHSNCPICRATIAVKRPNRSNPARHDDIQQGLPDASALV